MRHPTDLQELSVLIPFVQRNILPTFYVYLKTLAAFYFHSTIQNTEERLDRWSFVFLWGDGRFVMWRDIPWMMDRNIHIQIISTMLNFWTGEIKKVIMKYPHKGKVQGCRPFWWDSDVFFYKADYSMVFQGSF